MKYFWKMGWSLICCLLQGLIQGPGEFAEGLAIGARSLFGHTVGKYLFLSLLHIVDKFLRVLLEKSLLTGVEFVCQVVQLAQSRV